MAFRTKIVTTSDKSGEELGPEAVVVKVTWKGRAYALDLSPAEAAELEEAVAPFVKNATPQSNKRKTVARNLMPDYNQAAVRAWGQAKGLPVKDRGAVSKSVVEAFKAAGN